MTAFFFLNETIHPCELHAESETPYCNDPLLFFNSVLFIFTGCRTNYMAINKKKIRK